MDKKFAIVGGSLRERIIAEELRKNNFRISVYAMENMDDVAADSLKNCLSGASVLILPVVANDPDGKINGTILITESDLATMKRDAVAFAGIASEKLRRVFSRANIPLREIMEDDAVAVPNASLTAEGTLYSLMKRSKISVKEQYIGIFGWGRCGKACAKLFLALGSRVTVFCRDPKDLTEGRREGFDLRFYSGMAAVLPKVNVLINTVPAPIIDESVLVLLPREALLFDLASVPGGVDAKKAAEMEREIISLPGLPGRYAPVSAGRILANYYGTLFSGRGGEES